MFKGLVLFGGDEALPEEVENVVSFGFSVFWKEGWVNKFALPFCSVNLRLLLL